MTWFQSDRPDNLLSILDMGFNVTASQTSMRRLSMMKVPLWTFDFSLQSCFELCFARSVFFQQPAGRWLPPEKGEQLLKRRTRATGACGIAFVGLKEFPLGRSQRPAFFSQGQGRCFKAGEEPPPMSVGPLLVKHIPGVRFPLFFQRVILSSPGHTKRALYP